MPEDGRKVALVGGLGLAGLGVWFLIRERKPPAPPPGLSNLYGKVTDIATGKAIPNVLATLNGTQVYTDDNGNYIFEDLQPGAYILQFFKSGYETATY